MRNTRVTFKGSFRSEVTGEPEEKPVRAAGLVWVHVWHPMATLQLELSDDFQCMNCK